MCSTLSIHVFATLGVVPLRSDFVISRYGMLEMKNAIALCRLDPNRYIQYRLYRDSTQYMHGRHVRDLSKLNRDLGKVLFITASPEAGELQPENTIKVITAVRLLAFQTTAI
jgi:hypothetical protein